MLNQYSKLFFYNCVNLLQISSLHWLKKLWLRMACQGMKIILNLILLFIWFPGFPGIPGITSLKFPFPSLPVAICEFPFPSRKTGMWFSISLPVPGSQKAFPAHPWRKIPQNSQRVRICKILRQKCHICNFWRQKYCLQLWWRVGLYPSPRPQASLCNQLLWALSTDMVIFWELIS